MILGYPLIECEPEFLKQLQKDEEESGLFIHVPSLLKSDQTTKQQAMNQENECSEEKNESNENINNNEITTESSSYLIDQPNISQNTTAK